MSDNIFNAGQTPDQNNSGNANTAAPQNDNSFTDLLGNIKNEKGEVKYRDLPTALDALKHSQEYIPQLKTENETLKQELERLRKETDRIKALEETLERLSSNNNNQSQAAPVIDEKSVADLVTRTLSAREREAVLASNTKTVVSAMQNSLGADAEKVFYEKAAELGMTRDQINKMSAESPQVVLKLFGLEGKQQTQKAPVATTGGQNTSGYQQKPDSFARKNEKPILVGATSDDLIQEARNARQLVDELHSQGLSTYDLSDPKQFFKHFK